MKNQESFFEKCVAGLFILLWVFAGLGWILNLITCIGLDFKSPYKVEVIRGIGVISPIGSILGYIDIKD